MSGSEFFSGLNCTPSELAKAPALAAIKHHGCCHKWHCGQRNSCYRHKQRPIADSRYRPMRLLRDVRYGDRRHLRLDGGAHEVEDDNEGYKEPGSTPWPTSVPEIS
eukprot:776027-Rhodomonas_salina.3